MSEKMIFSLFLLIIFLIDIVIVCLLSGNDVPRKVFIEVEMLNREIERLRDSVEYAKGELTKIGCSEHTYENTRVSMLETKMEALQEALVDLRTNIHSVNTELFFIRNKDCKIKVIKDKEE